MQTVKATEQSIIVTYTTLQEAEEAIRTLADGGFPIQQISVIGKDLESDRDIHGFVTSGDVAMNGARMGAWVGGLFGLLTGAAVLFVPGFGPVIVAGPVAAWILGTFEGAIAGAAGGAVLGGLVGLGVSGDRIVKYEQEIKAGRHLVVAHGSAAEVTHARIILSTTTATEITASPGVPAPAL
jgi:hypothetical protein